MSRYDEFRDVLKGNVSMPGWSPATPSTGRMRKYPSDIDARDAWLWDKGAHSAQGFGDQTGLDVMTARMVEHGIYEDEDEIERDWGGSYYEMAEHYGRLPDPSRQQVEVEMNSWIRGWKPVGGPGSGEVRGPQLDRWEDRIAKTYTPTGVEPPDIQDVKFQVGTSYAPLEGLMRGRGAGYDLGNIRARAGRIAPPVMTHELGHHVSAKTPTGRSERRDSFRNTPGDTRTSPEEEAFADTFMERMVPGSDQSSYRVGSEYQRSAEWRDRYEGTRSQLGSQFSDILHEFRGR